MATLDYLINGGTSVIGSKKNYRVNDFWVDGSPEYRKLTDVWAADRAARFFNSTRSLK